MSNNNIFDGDSFKAIFSRAIYKYLLTREWTTYADIMADVNNLSSANELKYAISGYEGYGELKKAFHEVRMAIKEVNGMDSIETDGNNRNRRFRYVGENDDPLAEMIKAKVINDLRQYWRFCQDSAGFFPTSWLEYFFSGSRDLLEMRERKRKGEQVINADQDRQLTNIGLLPGLYENIINHQVLAVTYQPFNKKPVHLVFHPHLLKEYNGRWFVFGHAEDKEPENGYNLALDRIVGTPSVMKERKPVPPPPGFYSDYFKNIIGVTHTKGNEAQLIHIRAHNHYIFKLIETKRIHPSQETVKPFGIHENGVYGEFTVTVEMNNEFIGRILQMGAGLEIVSPADIRNLFKQRVGELYQLYTADNE